MKRWNRIHSYQRNQHPRRVLVHNYPYKCLVCGCTIFTYYLCPDCAAIAMDILKQDPRYGIKDYPIEEDQR